MDWTKRGVTVALIAGLQGCASIVGGNTQPISVQSMHGAELVTGAACALSNDKGSWFVNTPGSTTVQRSHADIQLKCTKDAMPAGELLVKSTLRPMWAGNVVFGGVVGGVVDMVSGAAYEYPTLVTVVLGQAGAAAEPAATTRGPYVSPHAASYTSVNHPDSPRRVAASTPAAAAPTAPAAPSTAEARSAPKVVAEPAVPAPPVVQAPTQPKGAAVDGAQTNAVAATLPSTPAVPRAIGQESYQVARMPEVKACNAKADPVLTDKMGASLETYRVACTNGTAITVRCEWGACRVTR